MSSCLFVFFSSFTFLPDSSFILFLSYLPFFCGAFYLFSSYRIFAARRSFFRYISDNVSRSIHSCLTLRSIRKRARNITLRVNKYFSNKSTRCECTPLFQPFSLFPFSPFLFFFYLTWHTARPICSTPIPSTYRIQEKHIAQYVSK